MQGIFVLKPVATEDKPAASEDKLPSSCHVAARTRPTGFVLKPVTSEDKPVASEDNLSSSCQVAESACQPKEGGFVEKSSIVLQALASKKGKRVPSTTPPKNLAEPSRHENEKGAEVSASPSAKGTDELSMIAQSEEQAEVARAPIDGKGAEGATPSRHDMSTKENEPKTVTSASLPENCLTVDKSTAPVRVEVVNKPTATNGQALEAPSPPATTQPKEQSSVDASSAFQPAKEPNLSKATDGSQASKFSKDLRVLINSRVAGRKRQYIGQSGTVLRTSGHWIYVKLFVNGETEEVAFRPKWLTPA